MNETIQSELALEIASKSITIATLTAENKQLNAIISQQDTELKELRQLLDDKTQPENTIKSDRLEEGKEG